MAELNRPKAGVGGGVLPEGVLVEGMGQRTKASRLAAHFPSPVNCVLGHAPLPAFSGLGSDGGGADALVVDPGSDTWSQNRPQR